jgi:DNA transposition AAA+ family ATPase
MNVDPGKIAFTEAEHAELRARVKARASAQNIAQAEIARQADIAPSTLSQYLGGTYPSEAGRIEVARSLTRWLKSLDAAAELRSRMPVDPTFVAMRGAMKITGILSYARVAGDLVIIAGSPGVSKTSTARQFQADNPRTWIATMDSTTSGAPMMLLEVLAAMGEPEAKGPPATLRRRICQLAEEAPGFLIVDEAQHLSDKAIEALRAINDRVGLGIALLGNEEIYAKVGVAGGKARFAQVSSRVGHRDYIVKPDPRDAETLAKAIAEANDEVIGKAEIAFCQDIAARPGGLRNVSKTFRKALIAARGADEPFDVSHLQGAFAQLAGHTR